MLINFLFFLSVPIIAVCQGDIAATCKTPFICSANLKSTFFTDAQIAEVDVPYAKDPFSSVTSYNDVQYAPAEDVCQPRNHSIDCNRDNPSSLTYHVVYPAGTFDYTQCKLPAIILFHGGGFVDCNGNNKSSDLLDFCREFAKRGFIAISVEYRLGVKRTTDPYYTAQQMLGIWRAGQDARGAIRSIVQLEADQIQPYRIDVNNLFVGGNSAGAVAAMTAAYYKPAMLNLCFPGANGVGVNSVLGPINIDYYYGPLTPPPYKIKGVLDMWGGALIPNGIDVNNPEDFFFANGNILPPTIAFCGAKDLTFNYMNQELLFLPQGAGNSQYRTQTVCMNDRNNNTSYTIINQAPNNGFILGSQDICAMLRRNGVLTEFYLDSEMGHGLSKPNEPYVSDFGTGAPDVTTTNQYIVQRAATFFQRVISNPALQLTTTKFVDCENTRVTCNAPTPPSTPRPPGCPVDNP